jgi:nitric oxide reductase NorQ protein
LSSRTRKEKKDDKMTMTDIEIINSALKDKVHTHYAMNEMDPSLSALLTALMVQSTGNKTLVGILESYKNAASDVRRRGAVSLKPASTSQKIQDKMSGKYPRPNGEDYYSRKWGEHEDVAVLRDARTEQQYILLYGAPGCGKTALVEGAFGGELLTILGSGDTEVADLVGGYAKMPDGEWAWNDGPLLQAAEQGKPLLIDEVGLIDPKVLSIVYGFMDGRKEYTVTMNPDRGTVKAKEGFYVIGATNPKAPGVVLSEALLSRFTLHVEMTTDWSLAKDMGVPHTMVTASQNLAKKQSSDEISWSPQFRELLAFRDIEKKWGTKFAIQNILAVSPEIDRPIVADVFSRAYGEMMLPARI